MKKIVLIFCALWACNHTHAQVMPTKQPEKDTAPSQQTKLNARDNFTTFLFALDSVCNLWANHKLQKPESVVWELCIDGKIWPPYKDVDNRDSITIFIEDSLYDVVKGLRDKLKGIKKLKDKGIANMSIAKMSDWAVTDGDGAEAPDVPAPFNIPMTEEDVLMERIEKMLNYGPAKQALARDHNDLAAYPAMEARECRKGKTVLQVRREFINYLHNKYKIPLRH